MRRRDFLKSERISVATSGLLVNGMTGEEPDFGLTRATRQAGAIGGIMEREARRPDTQVCRCRVQQPERMIEIWQKNG
jgi:hypothetical protein